MVDNKKIATVIRLAEFKDASCIAELLGNAFVEYKDLYTKKAYSQTTLSVYKIKERIYNKNVWIVWDDHAIIGTISLIPADQTLYIKSVAVAPNAQRKGLGKAMMNFAEQQALRRGFRFLELTTTHFLTSAINLYEGLGFERSGHKDLYGTPLIRMVKDLKQLSASSNPGQISLHKGLLHDDNN